MRFGSIPYIVLDLLGSDGGWLTTAGVTLMVPDARVDTIRKALTRLKSQDCLESRPRFPDAWGSENEWRITALGESKLSPVPA